MRPSLILWIVCLTAFSQVVHATTRDDLKKCTGSAIPTARIEACSRLIKSGLVDNTVKSIAHYNRGRAYRSLRNYDAAMQDFNAGIALNPNDPIAFLTRASLFTETGKYHLAIRDLTRAISLRPNYGYAYSSRGLAYAFTGEYDKAITDYDKALRINPNDILALLNKARLLASAPTKRIRDGAEAIRLTNRALALRRSAITLDTLAAGYAELGDFETAVKMQRSAIKMSKNQKRTRLTPIFQSHLELYLSRKPLRINMH